ASFAGRTGLFTAQSPGVTEVKRIEKGVESTVALIEVTDIDPRAKIRISPHEIDMGIVGPGETSEGLFHARKTGDEPADIRIQEPNKWKGKKQDAEERSHDPSAVMTETALPLKMTLRSLPGTEEGPVLKDGTFNLELTVGLGGRTAVYLRNAPAGEYRDAMTVNFNDRQRTIYFSYRVSAEESRPILELEPRGLTLGELDGDKVYMPKIRVRNAGKSILAWNAQVQGARSSFYGMTLPRGSFLSLYNEEVQNENFYRPPANVAEAIQMSGWWRGRGGYPERFAREDTIKYSFNGVGISISYFKTNGGGSFRAYVDGELVAEIDCFAQSKVRSEKLLASGLSGGSHELTIVAERDGSFLVEGFRTYGSTQKLGSGSWIRLSPARGSTGPSTDFVNVIINPGGLEKGLYSENILFDSNGGREIVEISFEVKQRRTSALIPVYFYRKGEDRILFSDKLTAHEGALSKYRKEGEAFKLFSPGTPGTADFYVWHHPVRDSWFYSYERSDNGKEKAGYVFLGSMGNIALIPLPETRELYRLYSPETRRYIFTTTLRGEEEQRRRGYRYDGIAGYVRQ
ncbi:MAG: hypothetical protein PHU03_05080, partial [Syntrophales bacterium]|nr:hypothetical protein [Syntrophales bacterium]